YQEQVMRVAHELAGFSMPQAEILMRAMGKKKIDLMEQMRPKFIEGAIANGINRETAERIFERMSAFARYAFNKSHSAAYALVAYQTAYLKANFPVAYMTCLLSVYKHFRSKIISALAECRRMGITILPPDINRSGSDFTVEGDAIRFGLSAIKNVGDAAAEAIVNERESNGPFRDILDFAQRISSQLVNRAALESLIKVGAFDQLHPNRNQLLATLAEERSPLLQALKSHRRTMPSQASLFDLSAELGVQTLLQLPDVPDAPLRKKWEWEQELLGFVLQRNLFEELPEVARRHITHEIGALAEQLEGRTVVVGGVVTSAKPIVDKRNRPMMFATLADHTGEVEVVLFSDVYQQYAQHLTSQALVLVSGKVRFRRAESGSEEIEHDSTIEPDVQVRLICEEVVPLEDLEARVAKSAQHISAAPAKKRKGRRRETSTQAQLTSQPARSSAPIKTLRVVLPPNRLTEQVLTRLRGIINAHKGSVPVELVIQNGSAVQRIALGASCCVDASGALRQELEALIGKGCVHTIT
ncbi:MAG TPA: DNA polymerase III subunit alpha, partial [Armatimonadetes bacterium]|nr:DNA polymerase III subunit alpha [Armatimonadota bacterium]